MMFLTVVAAALVGVAAAVPDDVCGYGSPIDAWNCGRGGDKCPSDHYCEISPVDAYAVCCPNYCGNNTYPLLDPADGTAYFCGRGPNRVSCPDTYRCNVSPVDAWAVCCPV